MKGLALNPRDNPTLYLVRVEGNWDEVIDNINSSTKLKIDYDPKSFYENLCPILAGRDEEWFRSSGIMFVKTKSNVIKFMLTEE